MNAFMFPETAAELLAKYREFTSAKRAERETKQRQTREFEAAFAQLLRYRPAPSRVDCFEALTDNGKAIYRELETRYGFAHG